MPKNGFSLLLFILIGAVLGGVLGQLLSALHPIFSYGQSIGFDPFTIDLAVLTVTLGFKMSLTLSGIVGLLLSLWLFSRLR